MARECAAGRGRALALPRGRTRGRCVRDSPTDRLPDPGDPEMPEGAPLSSRSFGSLGSNFSTSEGPVPPALWGTRENRPPRPSPLRPNPVATGAHTILQSRPPPLFQECGKLGPRLHGRPGIKFLGLLPPGVQDPGP